MLLLQDEQPEVREEAARFASLIPREGALLSNVDVNHIHCSTGLKVSQLETLKPQLIFFL